MYWERRHCQGGERRERDGRDQELFAGDGHGGASGRYDRLKDSAFDYAYILREMGIEN
jgi:protease II